MTATMTPPTETKRESFASYVQRLKDSTPTDAYLGYLVWYGVSDNLEVKRDKLISHLKTSKAPVPAPAQVAAADVFRRACTAVEKDWRRCEASSHVPGIGTVIDHGTWLNFMVRDAGVDDEKIYKSVVVEVVDAEEHVVSQDTIGDIEFTKATSKITSSPASGDDNAANPYEDKFNAIVASIGAYVVQRGDLINAYRIRESFRKAMEQTLLSVSVKSSGGIYFVQRNYGKELGALGEFASLLSEHGGVEFHVVPLIDDREQRKMLKAAFEGETIGSADRLLEEIHETLKSGRISEAKQRRLTERFMLMKKSVKQYSNLLDETLGDVDAKMAFCEKAWEKLTDLEES